MNQLTKQPWSLRNVAVFLLVCDIIGLFWCFHLAFWLRLEQFIDWSSPVLYGLIVAYLLGLYLADTYRLRIEISGLWAPARVILSIIAISGVTAIVIYLTGLWGREPLVGRGVLLISSGLFTIWAVIWRFLVARWIWLKIPQSRWLVLGSKQSAMQFGQEYCSANSRAELVLLTENQDETKLHSGGNILFFIGSLDEFDAWSEQVWSGVLIEHQSGLPDMLVKKLMKMRLRGVFIDSLANFYEQFLRKVPPSCLRDDWFAFTSGFSLIHNRINIKLKRLFDILIAGLLLLVFSPLMLLSALAVKLDSRGPIFYNQIRTGQNKREFQVHKFRTMYQNAEKQGVQWAKTKDPRITRVGRWFRLMRIDELPQLWNVLKGEMSLIGPRPERPVFDVQLAQKIPYYDVRYLVKPGITGWAQVMYPYGASVEDAYQKLAYDLYYIRNYSLLLDFAIALKTMRVVLLGKGR